MRTNIEIDDRLMRDAMRASGGKTKKAVVDAALRVTTSFSGTPTLLETRAASASRRRAMYERASEPEPRHLGALEI